MPRSVNRGEWFGYIDNTDGLEVLVKPYYVKCPIPELVCHERWDNIFMELDSKCSLRKCGHHDKSFLSCRFADKRLHLQIWFMSC